MYVTVKRFYDKSPTSIDEYIYCSRCLYSDGTFVSEEVEETTTGVEDAYKNTEMSVVAR